MDQRMPLITFLPTDPRCHGNEIWDKFHCNSASVRDFFEIFLPKLIGVQGVSGISDRTLPIAFFWPIPVAMPLKWQRNLEQNWL